MIFIPWGVRFNVQLRSLLSWLKTLPMCTLKYIHQINTIYTRSPARIRHVITHIWVSCCLLLWKLTHTLNEYPLIEILSHDRCSRDFRKRRKKRGTMAEPFGKYKAQSDLITEKSLVFHSSSVLAQESTLLCGVCCCTRFFVVALTVLLLRCFFIQHEETQYKEWTK